MVHLLHSCGGHNGCLALSLPLSGCKTSNNANGVNVREHAGFLGRCIGCSGHFGAWLGEVVRHRHSLGHGKSVGRGGGGVFVDDGRVLEGHDESLLVFCWLSFVAFWIL